jgi:polar amino acid transport system permease protein
VTPSGGPGDGTAERPPAETVRAVPVRHPGRWVSAALVLVLAAMFVHTVAVSKVSRGGIRKSRFELDVIQHYFTSRQVLDGLQVTIELTVIAMVIGIALGIGLAVLRLSPNPLLSGASWLYIWFFRGTPVLVQLLFWYFVSYLYPHLTLGVPFGPALVHFNLNTLITPFRAGIIALGLNEGAYMAEIVRAGIISVDEGQTEAAQALGMSRLQNMRRIVLPQAMRVIVPPTGNETISMLKTSSLAATITVGELLFKVQNIYGRTYQTIPLLMVASLWYLIVTSVLTFGQYYVERYFARGATRQLPPTPLQRLRTQLARVGASSRELRGRRTGTVLRP